MTYVGFHPNPLVVSSLAPIPRPRSLLGLLGLGGTYEEQYAAYEKDLKRWKEEKVAYDYAMAMYNNMVQGIDYSYQRALSEYTNTKYPAYMIAKADYDNKLAAYQSKMSVYNQQKAGYDQTVSAMRSEYQRLAKAAATKYGLTLPTGFTCISPQAKAYYDTFDCTVVKGIGAYSTYGSACGAQKLPVCNYPPSPSHPGSPPMAPVKPASPVKGKYPTKPADLRPMPQPPVGSPSSTTLPPPVTSLSPPPADEPQKKMSMVKGGLIAVVVVVGGVALYRTFKKPKAS